LIFDLAFLSGFCAFAFRLKTSVSKEKRRGAEFAENKRNRFSTLRFSAVSGALRFEGKHSEPLRRKQNEKATHDN